MTRHYTVNMNIVVLGALEAAAYTGYFSRKHLSEAELYRGLSAAMCTGIILVYNFSRLTVRNTAIIVLVGTSTAVYFAFQVPSVQIQQFGRLMAQMVIANLVAFSLRNSIETRERDLFSWPKKMPGRTSTPGNWKPLSRLPKKPTLPNPGSWPT